jgi:hypothetical protein
MATNKRHPPLVQGVIGPQGVGVGSIGALAAMRSAWPSAAVIRASPIGPERFFHRVWPMKQNLASTPEPLR